MFVILIILGFVAVAAAKKAPNMGGEALPPDTSLPATGATDKFSPVISGNSPLVARDNRLRLDMVYENPQGLTTRFTGAPVRAGTLQGIQGGLTDAEAGLKTQDVPPLVTNTAYMPSSWNSRKF